MGALKKHPTRSDVNWRAAKALKNFAGFIFVCSKSTIPDLDRGIFGLPRSYEDSVRRIQKGMPLFLFNYTNRRLYGVFEAVSNGGINLDPHAWESTHHSKSGRCATPVSKYPAQVKVSIRAERPALIEDIFRPLVDYIDNRKFRLELTALQVQQLLDLFDAAHSSERELLAERHGDNYALVPYRNHNYVAPYRDLESPRSASNPESDSYSDYSSHGLNSYEDEWTDGLVSERFRGVDLGDPSTYVNGHVDRPHKSDEGLSGVDLGDRVPDTSGHVSMPSYHDDPQSACKYDGQERAGRRSSCKSTFCNGSNHNNIMLSRLQDSDPAVNSNSSGHMEVGVSEPVSSEMQVRYGNVIYIPVQPVQPQQSECGSLSGPQKPKRSNRKRHSKGCTVNTAKLGSNSDRVHKFKDPKYQNEQLPCENGVACSQKLQLSQMVVPVSSQKSDELHDEAQLATALFPLSRASNSEALNHVHHSAGVRADGQGHDFGATNNIQLTPEELEHLLQNGHYPIVLMPPPMPRQTASPQPITAGFVEALHFEILRFARWTRPSSETQLHVEAAIDCVRKGVKAVWPEADVEVFGSFATGLCLHHSDVDLAVIDAPQISSAEGLSIAQASALLIRELAAELGKFEWCESITPLETASMPVLKCNCWPFGGSLSTTNAPITISPINVDITIGGMRNSHFNWNPAAQVLDMADQATDMGKFTTRHTGGLAREYVLHKIQELPALAPLVLLLKSYLHHRNLSNVYTGGLGSFSLTLLVAFYLERVAVTGDVFSSNNGGSPTSLMSFPVSCSSECSDDSDAPSSSNLRGDSNWNIEKEHSGQSLGKCFVRRAADVVKSVLSLWDGEGSPYLGTLLLGFLQSFGFELELSCEKIILKSKSSSGGFFKRDDRHVALWIDDPLRPGVNIGAGSYNMVNVQNAFKEMLQALTKCPVFYPSLECKEQDCRDLAAISQLAHLGRLIVPANDY